MKKNALRNILLSVSILGLITACPSCATAKDTEKGAAESVSTTDVDGKGPTGLPNGMIDRPQIWIDGTLYYYHFDGEIYLLPEDHPDRVYIQCSDDGILSILTGCVTLICARRCWSYLCY